MYQFNETIIHHLSNSDPVMMTLIKHVPLNSRISSFKTSLEGLIDIVISQQLALSVASKLNEAFLNTFGPMVKAHLLTFTAEDFKSIGLSRAKSETIERIVHSSIDFEALKDASNEIIFNTLTSLKGLGPWSAEMFIMFIKEDQNFFSFNDGGIKNALKTFYNGVNHQALAEKFDPYKSYACLVLWEALSLKKILLKKMEEDND